MSIKAALAKSIKGEALTDEEKELLTNFDPDKAAAAARKEGLAKTKELEAKLAELQDQLENAGNATKSEAEKLKADHEKATKKLAELKTQLDATLAEKAKFIRDTKLDRIVGRIKTVPGIEPEVIKMALASKLGALKDEDLDSEEAVGPVLKAFRESNKALILDDSGSGSGTKNDGSTRAGGAGDSDPSKQSDAERLKALRELAKS